VRVSTIRLAGGLTAFACTLACAVLACAEAHIGHPIKKLIDADHWKRARALAVAQLESNPRDVAALTWMSIIEESFNRWDSAKSYAERAVAADPGYPDAHAQLARINAELAETAPVWKQVGLVRTMKRELEAAYRIEPANLDALLTDMMFTFKAPGIVGGGRTKAHDIAQKILRYYPDWGRMAEAKLAQNENNEPSALRWLRDGSSGNYRIQSNLGQVLCCLSPHPQLDEAIRIAQSLVRSDPGRADGYALLVRSYVAKGSLTEVDAVLEQALRNVPDDLSAHYWAARSLVERKKDPQRAEMYLRQYLAQEPEGRAPTAAEARWTLGLSLEQQDRKPEATREVFKLRPDIEGVRRDYKRMSEGS
jgi:tetratricopeptide (TPR) repeat protein